MNIDIDIEAFTRLHSGDLKHIGDAIAKGEAIEFLYDGNKWREVSASNLSYSTDSSFYRVKPKTAQLYVSLHRNGLNDRVWTNSYINPAAANITHDEKQSEFVKWLKYDETITLDA